MDIPLLAMELSIEDLFSICLEKCKGFPFSSFAFVFSLHCSTEISETVRLLGPKRLPLVLRNLLEEGLKCRLWWICYRCSRMAKRQLIEEAEWNSLCFDR